MKQKNGERLHTPKLRKFYPYKSKKLNYLGIFFKSEINILERWINVSVSQLNLGYVQNHQLIYTGREKDEVPGHGRRK